jgi:hypothetical protein
METSTGLVRDLSVETERVVDVVRAHQEELANSDELPESVVRALHAAACIGSACLASWVGCASHCRTRSP